MKGSKRPKMHPYRKQSVGKSRGPIPIAPRPSEDVSEKVSLRRKGRRSHQPHKIADKCRQCVHARVKCKRASLTGPCERCKRLQIDCLPRDPSPVFHDIEESTFEEKEAFQTPSEFAPLPAPEKQPVPARQKKGPPDKLSSHPKRKEKAGAQKTGLPNVESSQTPIVPKPHIPDRIGNNPYGARGTMKCDTCRKKKQTCVFVNPDEDCKHCARLGLPCGPKIYATSQLLPGAFFTHPSPTDPVPYSLEAKKSSFDPPLQVTKQSHHSLGFSQDTTSPGYNVSALGGRKLSDMILELEREFPDKDVFEINDLLQKRLEHSADQPPQSHLFRSSKGQKA